MFHFFVLFAVFSHTAKSIATDATTAPVFQRQSRIVDGKEAVLGQFPFQVSLRAGNGNHFCGGSIIGPEWVVTAAHCMLDGNRNQQRQSDEFVIVAGEIILKNEYQAKQRREIEEIHVHPKFDNLTFNNDICLLKIKEPFEFDKDVSDVPISRSRVKSPTVCTLSGWGRIDESVTVPSARLMYVNLPLVSKKLCNKLMFEYKIMQLHVICAGFVNGGKDACNGDSGSGLICKGHLSGIVSFGAGCGRPDRVGVYTDVHHYSPWIKSVTNITNVIENKIF